MKTKGKARGEPGSSKTLQRAKTAYSDGQHAQVKSANRINGEARRADSLWSREQYLSLFDLMLNENAPNFILLPFRDKDTDEVCYKKAFNVVVADRAPWAHDTITGKAARPASIGFYPTNHAGRSRWGA